MIATLLYDKGLQKCSSLTLLKFMNLGSTIAQFCVTESQFLPKS